MKTARIAVFVSGGGTNLQALIDAQQKGIITSGKIELVVANNSNAYALERAKNAGIPSAVVLKKELGSQEAFENRLKGRRKKNRKRDEVAVELTLWQKYKYYLFPLCAIVVVVFAWYIAHAVD